MFFVQLPPVPASSNSSDMLSCMGVCELVSPEVAVEGLLFALGEAGPLGWRVFLSQRDSHPSHGGQH